MKINVYEFFKRFSDVCPDAKGCRIVGASGTQYLFDGFSLGKIKVRYANGGDTTLRNDCILLNIEQETIPSGGDRPFAPTKTRPVIHIAIDRSRPRY